MCVGCIVWLGLCIRPPKRISTCAEELVSWYSPQGETPLAPLLVAVTRRRRLFWRNRNKVRRIERTNNVRRQEFVCRKTGLSDAVAQHWRRLEDCVDNLIGHPRTRGDRSVDNAQDPIARHFLFLADHLLVIFGVSTDRSVPRYGCDGDPVRQIRAESHGSGHKITNLISRITNNDRIERLHELIG